MGGISKTPNEIVHREKGGAMRCVGWVGGGGAENGMCLALTQSLSTRGAHISKGHEKNVRERDHSGYMYPQLIVRPYVKHFGRRLCTGADFHLNIHVQGWL